MGKIRVLHIGIKNWPYDSAFSLSGKRGGGSSKYCDMLIKAYSDKVDSTILTQLVHGQNKKDIYADNITVHRLKTAENRKTRLILLNIKSFFKAIKIIKKENIDIIHGHILPGIITAYFLGAIFRKPVVATPYNIYFNESKSSIINSFSNFLEKFFYKRVDKLVFESEDNKKKAITILDTVFDNSVTVNTGMVLPNNYLQNIFVEYPINMVFIGRLVKVKALDLLIESFRLLDSNILEKLHLDIIGEGEEIGNLQKLISNYNFDKFIKIHGFVKDSDLFINKANIFILPSHTEGLSIALLEAMANGLACIVNNYGVPFSSDEVYIMINNNPSSIASALTKFVKTPTLINEYGEKAYLRIKNDFSIEAFGYNYLSIYKELIN